MKRSDKLKEETRGQLAEILIEKLSPEIGRAFRLFEIYRKLILKRLRRLEGYLRRKHDLFRADHIEKEKLTWEELYELTLTYIDLFKFILMEKNLREFLSIDPCDIDLDPELIEALRVFTPMKVNERERPS